MVQPIGKDEKLERLAREHNRAMAQHEEQRAQLNRRMSLLDDAMYEVCWTIDRLQSDIGHAFGSGSDYGTRLAEGVVESERDSQHILGLAHESVERQKRELITREREEEEGYLQAVRSLNKEKPSKGVEP